MLQDCERTIQVLQTAFQASLLSIQRTPPRERDVTAAALERRNHPDLAMDDRWARPDASRTMVFLSWFGSGRSRCSNWSSDAFFGIDILLTWHWEGFGVSGSGKRVVGAVEEVAWNAIAVAHFRFRFRG